MRRADRRAVHALLDDELSAAEAAALRARAAADPELAAYLARMEALRGALGTLLPPTQPPSFSIPTTSARTPRMARRRLAFAVAVVLALTAGLALRPDPEPSPQVEVRFSLDAPQASTVEVAGDFSGWRPVPLTREGDVWRGVIALWPGRYAYMYRVDGQWTTDPKAHSFRDDDFGRRNAVLHL